jgi:hypothetical protein
MKTKLRLLTILLLLISSINSFAQDGEKLSRNEVNELAEKADLSFEEKKYLDALVQFTQLYNDEPSDTYYKLMRGFCLTYDPAKKRKQIIKVIIYFIKTLKKKFI